MESANPCCSKWVKAYKKLEGKRNALRNGVEILQKQIDLLQQDNASLKKACDEERARVNVVEKEKGEEASLRISMEKEIAALKSKTSSIGPQATFGNEGLDNEATHLRTCISEKEMEIDRLKQLLADEITRVNVEKNAAELEKKNVAELQKSLEYEKRKAEEASKMSDAAARKAEDHRIQLETLRNELEKTNLKWVEVNRKLEAEKQEAIKEKRCSDEKRVQEEECRANYFTRLEEEKQKVEKLQNELQKIMTLKSSVDASELDEVKRKLEAEKNEVAKEKRRVAEEKVKVSEQRKIAEACEKRVSEEKCRADEFMRHFEEEKQKVENLQRELQEVLSSQKAIDSSQFDELKKNLEEERKKVVEEQMCVEEEKARVMEQRKIADANKKRGTEEKYRADNLFIQLEEEKLKVEKLQRELQEALSSRITIDSSDFHELKRNLEEEKKKVAQEQRCVEEEKVRTMEQKKIADANKKRFSEEKCRNDKLLMELEEEKRKVEELQRELQEGLPSQKAIDSSVFDELKRNLEEEKKKVAQEQRCVEEEKVRTMEQKKIADANKKRFSEEKCHNDKLLMELDEEKRKVEELQRELQEGLPSQKAIDSSVFDELKRNLEEEKKNVAQGQRCVEEEKVRTIEQKKIADATKKVASEEKSRADKLLVLLEEEKRKVDKLQRELQEVVSSKKPAKSSELDEVNRNLEAEKKKVARERKRGDLETFRKEEQKNLAEASIKNAMEEKSRADKLFEELVSSREMIKNLESELNNVNGMLKAERIEVAREKTRADLQKLKSEEQGQIAVTNEMRALEEKSRGDNLFQELVNARKQLQDVEHELNEVKLCRGLNRTSVVSPFSVNEQAARVTLLQEQLKFEKKRVKHAKEVAKLEKDRNSILQQELKRLKQDFQCLLDHLGMLSDSFGTRNGVAKILKKSGLPQMRYHGDDELRTSSLSSKDASCRFKPNTCLVQAGLCMESTSGMENELDPLQGGSRGDTIQTSALNSNTASFSDEQLPGSQERVAGSLNMSVGLSVENPKQRATILRDSNECYKGKTGEKVCIAGEHSIKSPVEAVTDRAKKRRKILDEIESIKHMHLDGKIIFQEAEKKLFTLQNTLLQPLMNDQLEKENFPLPVNKNKLSGDSDWSSKKRKILREPDLVFRQANDPNVEMEVDKTFAPSATETRGISQPSTDLEIDRVEHIQDTLADFEQVINGDYMKLLDLDDAVAEECFKMAMERPLSPLPPELLEFGQKARALTLSEPISGDKKAEHQAYNENQLFFVLFTDLEDINSITRIYGATRACLARCLFFQTDFSLQDILMALLLEKDLRPREKACVLFSLILLNFSAVSSSKPVNFRIQELMDSFSANIHSVLFNSETRELFAKICDVRELLTLSEDFVLKRKTMSDLMLLGGCGSSVEILLEGKKIVLWPKMASTDLVVAGSIVFASISKAVGHTGYVCEVSLKILQIDRVEYSLALKVLHSFAHVCGEEYFSISNYSSVMNVVRSVATFMEGTIAKNAVQPVDNSLNQFTPCVRCPFSEGSVSVDVVSSELLEELQSHIVPQDPAVSAHPSNREALNCFLGDVLSSLELISSIMGWDWLCDKIVPKLFKMLESSHQDRVFTTALVVLLGDIGRLGVKARGYDDAGVEGIKRHLLGLLYQTAASKCDTTLPMAIVYGLIGLYPKGLEMFQKGNSFELPAVGGHSASASSDIVSKFLSSLSSEQITSLASLVNPDNRCS